MRCEIVRLTPCFSFLIAGDVGDVVWHAFPPRKSYRTAIQW
jgi:hypothetical protein